MSVGLPAVPVGRVNSHLLRSTKSPGTVAVAPPPPLVPPPLLGAVPGTTSGCAVPSARIRTALDHVEMSAPLTARTAYRYSRPPARGPAVREPPGYGIVALSVFVGSTRNS